jgi:hypothetical protein
MRASSPLRISLLAASSALLLACAPSSQQRQTSTAASQSWAPLSTTATAITGQIELADQRLTFANGAYLPLALLEHDAQSGLSLYQVTSPDNPVLLNGNLLCGQKPVDYLTVQVTDAAAGQSDMQLTAYYYPQQLRLSQLPLQDQDDPYRSMCALYTYVESESGQ